MQLLFCSDPLAPARVDEAFDRERAAATAAGLTSALIDHDLVVAGRAREAVRRVAPDDGRAVYRG